jgi:hypothetical protein
MANGKQTMKARHATDVPDRMSQQDDAPDAMPPDESATDSACTLAMRLEDVLTRLSSLNETIKGKGSCSGESAKDKTTGLLPLLANSQATLSEIEGQVSELEVSLVSSTSRPN